MHIAKIVLYKLGLLNKCLQQNRPDKQMSTLSVGRSVNCRTERPPTEKYCCTDPQRSQKRGIKQNSKSAQCPRREKLSSADRLTSRSHESLRTNERLANQVTFARAFRIAPFSNRSTVQPVHIFSEREKVQKCHGISVHTPSNVIISIL